MPTGIIVRPVWITPAMESVPPYNAVVFGYVEPQASRPDIVPLYEGGSVIKTLKRLTHVYTYHNGVSPVREYRLVYGPNGGAVERSRLASIQECGSDGICLPPTALQWSSGGTGGAGQTVTVGISPGFDWSGTRTYADVNGDGKADYCRIENPGSYKIYCTINLGSGGAQQVIVTNVSPGYYGSGWEGTQAYVDVNGDGKADYCRIENPGSYKIYCTINLGSGGAQQVIVTNVSPGFDWSGTRAYVDVNGDGKADFCRIESPGGVNKTYCTINLGSGGAQQVIVTNVSPGYYGSGWEGTQAYVDVNGDGKADYCRIENPGSYKSHCTINLGSGGAQQVIVTNVSPGFDWSETRAYVDVNGDGMADFCRIESPGGVNKTYCTINLGAGGAQQVIVTNVSPGFDWSGTRTYADVNGDGKTDYCRTGRNPGSYIALSNLGSGGAQQVIVTNVSPGYYGSGWEGTQAYVDVNGDGKADYMWNWSDGWYVANSIISSVDIVSSITSGTGTQTAITYKPLTDSSVYTRDSTAAYPYRDVQNAMYVVSQSTQSNGIGGVNTATYQYGGLKTHHTAATSLGFRWVQTTDLAGLTHVTYYNQIWDGTEGTVASNATYAGSVLIKSMTNTWTPIPAGGRTIVVLANTVEQATDLNRTGFPRHHHDLLEL